MWFFFPIIIKGRLKKVPIVMRFLRLFFVMLLMISSLAACFGLGLSDVTNQSPYSNMVGLKYSVQKPVWLIGITYGPKYQSKLEFLTLVPGVGFSGPEVILRERIVEGTVIEIKRVLLEQSVFSSTVEYIIEIHGYEKNKEVVKKLRLSRGNEGGGIELNELFYKKNELGSDSN